MRTRHFLWSALLGIVLALSGCAKDDIQKSTDDEIGTSRAVNSLFSLEQAKAYVNEQSDDIFAADLGTQSTLSKLYPNWTSARAFETEDVKGYYVSLAGNQNAILEAFGGTPCSDACDHDHGVAGENETIAISTLFVKKNVETDKIMAYVQTNVRSSENIHYVLYSSLQGDLLSASQTVDGKTSPLKLSAGISASTKRYGTWCDICNIWISDGSPISHPRCHTCMNPKASCICPGGGGNPPAPEGQECPSCGAVGDPRCAESGCSGSPCSICGKLGQFDLYWNVTLHGRDFCGPVYDYCTCLCPVCNMHPNSCKCCPTCNWYPCICVIDTSCLYTPPVGSDQLHITVPKADIRTALGELHTH